MYNFKALLLLIWAMFNLVGCDKNTSNIDVTSTFAQVEQTSSINCGYISYPPAAFKDEKGELKGIFVEAMDKAASNLGWKVNWIEGNWPDLISNLNSGRWDAFCAAAWKNSARIKAADFGMPLYYSYLSVWGKEGLNISDINQLNSKDYTVAVLDGDTSLTVANNQFSNAKQNALTQLNSYSDIFDLVTSGRADFTIAEASYVISYNKSSEQNLGMIGDAPVQIYPNAMMFRKEDIALRRAVSGALEELLNQGYITTLIDKYAKDEVLEVAPPYKL
jgi:ABC-type amino acid transport substrate-binding protein